MRRRTVMVCCVRVFFFFKQKTAYEMRISDWSSDVCSSDLERASHLARADGIVGLLTPSGIAADKGAAPFLRSIATTGRLGALFDFENKKVFFPDIHASFKFCALVFGDRKRVV